ncbi:MAG: tRNA (adenosine(37)-N6)-threonylcarbamoyltransferase complex ATPase subunit type 1 TsaE [Balneolaceae bacterium]|nr:tRNA (adenosine(37)-N6)-threonylcarbamoyltransferase complex ATPase subunit type 1 TsaE [Balneolaceae bacterium]MDR9447364.1 tRNA (adenosine(37)-N6)-threonylcarbamoyltransferase complex ATPase subunit type 1 TsaE [Balneolaceae bacterium]
MSPSHDISHDISYDITTLEQLDEFAKAWATTLKPGALVTLSGELGAGKTTLVKAVVGALGGEPNDVQSPTFSILHHYRAVPAVIHIDAYRLEGVEDAMRAGIQDVLASEGPDAITFVEWPEKVPSLWGPVTAHVTLADVEHAKKKQRTLTIESSLPS